MKASTDLPYRLDVVALLVVSVAVWYMTLGLCEAFDAISLSSCNVSKGCIRWPPNCNTIDTCHYLLTYQHTPTGQHGDTVQFELSASVDITTLVNPYVAFGLSYDDQMGDDSVIACFSVGTSVVAAGIFYNTAYKTNEHLSQNTESLSEITGLYSEGRIQCRVSRPVASTHAWIYDLTNSWYILIAKGNFNIFHGRLEKHSETPFVSELPRRIVYTTPDDISTSTITTATSVPTVPPADTEVSVSGCGSSHVCTWYPPACITDTSAGGAGDVSQCEYLLTLTVSTSDTGLRYLEGAMAANTGSIVTGANTDGHYVAVGFSHDNRMSNDSVVMCSSTSQGLVAAYIYYNSNYFTIKVDQASNMIVDLRGGITDQGMLWCRFRRIEMSNPPPNIKHLVFDLTRPGYLWYILMARGAADNGKPLAHGYKTLPLVSRCASNLWDPSTVNAYPPNLYNDNEQCEMTLPPTPTPVTGRTSQTPPTTDTDPVTDTMTETVTASAWPSLNGNWRYFLPISLFLPGIISFARTMFVQS